MYFTTSLFVAALLPLLTVATDVPSGTSQVIVPFSTLPLCAQKCGPLFDAQGACGQTALTSTSQSCFCSYTTLTPFKTSTAGVCDASVSGCSAADLTTIQTWYKTYCASTSTATTASGNAASTATGTAAAAATSSKAASTASSSGGDWLSTHYKYVIMIVIVCVGLAAIWIAGCLLRRRHMRNRDRAFEMGGPDASWGPSSSHTDFHAAGAGAVGASSAAAMQSKEAFAMSRSSSFFGGGGPQDHASFYQPAPMTKGKSRLNQEVEQNEKTPTGKLSKFLPGRH